MPTAEGSTLKRRRRRWCAARRGRAWHATRVVSSCNRWSRRLPGDVDRLRPAGPATTKPAETQTGCAGTTRPPPGRAPRRHAGRRLAGDRREHRRRPAGRASPSPGASPAAAAAVTPANPMPFKAPTVKASGADDADLLALRPVPQRRPEGDRRRVQGEGRPERLAGDHRLPEPERPADGRQGGAGGRQPDPGHHRRGAGRRHRRLPDQRRRHLDEQVLRAGQGVQGQLLAERAPAADDQRPDRLGARRHQHGRRLLQQEDVRRERRRRSPRPGTI